MTPFLAVPSIQAQFPAQVSAVAVAEISTIKLPIDAVPSPVRPEAAHNHTRGAASPLLSGVPGAVSVPGGGSALTPEIAGLNFRPGVRFSSPFLAQLFAQTSGGQLSVVAGFFANDNLPKGIADPALMALYSQVKYKPSNAGLPPVSSQGNQEVMQSQQQYFMQQLADQKTQMMQNQIRATQATSGAYRPAQASFPFHAVPVRPLPPESRHENSDPAPSRGGSAFSGKPLRSLVLPTGIEAYLASFSRNSVHLTGRPDAVKVAL